MLKYSVNEIKQFQVWAKMEQTRRTIAYLKGTLGDLEKEAKRIAEVIG